MPMMLPARAAKNLTPSSTGFGSFTAIAAGTLSVENRLYTTGAMVKVSVADPVPTPLEALRVTLNVPATVAAPEMTPVVVLMESPAGNPVVLKLVGLLLAVIV